MSSNIENVIISPVHRHGPARKLRPHNDFNGFRSTNVSRMACAQPIFKKNTQNGIVTHISLIMHGIDNASKNDLNKAQI